MDVGVVAGVSIGLGVGVCASVSVDAGVQTRCVRSGRNLYFLSAEVPVTSVAGNPQLGRWEAGRPGPLMAQVPAQEQEDTDVPALKPSSERVNIPPSPECGSVLALDGSGEAHPHR